MPRSQASDSDSASADEGPSGGRRRRGMPSDTPAFLTLSAGAEREGRRRSASRSRSRSESPVGGVTADAAGSSSQPLAGYSFTALTEKTRKSRSRSRSQSPVGGVTSGAALGENDVELLIEHQVQGAMASVELSRQENEDRADVARCEGRCFWCLEESAVHFPSGCSKREMPVMTDLSSANRGRRAKRAKARKASVLRRCERPRIKECTQLHVLMLGSSATAHSVLRPSSALRPSLP